MLRKRSVSLELRLRAQQAARREAMARLRAVAIRFVVGMAAVLGLVVMAATDVMAREPPRIEDLNQSQLEKLLRRGDSHVAVFWYSRNCRNCDEALDELEGVAADGGSGNGVVFVKVNDKRMAKAAGVRRFPALSFHRRGAADPSSSPVIFDGDLTDDDDVLDFLTGETTMVIPDKIEEVSADALMDVIREERFVTALFYDSSKSSSAAVAEMEKIDDEADVLKIRFVKIRDASLAEEYSLTELPSLVYFRDGLPIVYHGNNLGDEAAVLEWLIDHQTTGDVEDARVEAVEAGQLEVIVRNVDNLLVLFHDEKKKSKMALEALENVDDDCDDLGVGFVSTSDPRAISTVDNVPSLVYFESGELRATFPADSADVTDGDEVLSWLRRVMDPTSGVEEVRGTLDALVAREEAVVVLFYDQEVENYFVQNFEELVGKVGDLGVRVVKCGQRAAADEYGVEATPALVVFERGVPNLYRGGMEAAEALAWVRAEATSSANSAVEVVTDRMLDRLVSGRRNVAVLFYDRKGSDATAVDGAALGEAAGVAVVKTSDPEDAEEYGVTKLPSLVLFRNGAAVICPVADLGDAASVAAWLAEEAAADVADADSVADAEAALMADDDAAGVLLLAGGDDREVTNRTLAGVISLRDELEDFFRIKLMKHIRDEEAEDEEDEDNDDEDDLANFLGGADLKEIPALVLILRREDQDEEINFKVFSGDVEEEREVLEWVRIELQQQQRRT